MPVPIVLEHYVDQQAGRSYTLLSYVPGEDSDEAWKELNEGQQKKVLNQIAEHIHTLAKLSSDRLSNAEEGLVWEPYLCLGSAEAHDLYPEKSKEWEAIWGAEQNEFVLYHADLGPGNIKVEIQMTEAKVVGILYWEIAGYLPKAWVATKAAIGSGLDFDWDGAPGEQTWRAGLLQALVNMGYKKFGLKW